MGISPQPYSDILTGIVDPDIPRLEYDSGTGTISGYPDTPNTPYLNGNIVSLSSPSGLEDAIWNDDGIWYDGETWTE